MKLMEYFDYYLSIEEFYNTSHALLTVIRINTYHWQLKALQTMPEMHHREK